MTLALLVIKNLIRSQKTCSVAESCTGGYVGHLLTNIPGSSTVFKGGIIAYDNVIKNKILKVPTSILRTNGAVSQEAVSRMARQVQKIFTTNYALSISGVAGPGGGTPLKPIGLVFIALATPKKIICRKFLFSGTRIQIKSLAAQQALKLLLTNIECI